MEFDAIFFLILLLLVPIAYLWNKRTQKDLEKEVKKLGEILEQAATELEKEEPKNDQA